MTMIGNNWRRIRADVDAACRASSRDPSTVTLVAVSKLHPVAAVDAVVAAGAADCGENYVQELVAKQAAVAIAPRWHFIGRLQRNKARQIAGRVAVIHAVDTVELAAEIGKRAPPDSPQSILLAINLADEASKSGMSAAAVPTLLAAITEIPGVRVDGLMTMPPPTDDPEHSRRHFAALRELRDRLATTMRPLPELSMGMSGDFAVAIDCGATIVRIGTAIFGDRPH
jgi:PLP dependent protein